MRNEFVSIVSKFLDGSLSLVEMQEWILSRLQTILDSGDSVCAEIANEIDADLISLSEELMDESVFIKRLYGFRDRLQTILIEYTEKTLVARTVTSQVADTFNVPLTAPADLQFHFRTAEFSGAGK